MQIRIIEPNDIFCEYELQILDDTDIAVLDEVEIIELAGITAQLAAKIAQRRADEKAKSTVTRCEGVIRGVDTSAYSVGEAYICDGSEEK